MTRITTLLWDIGGVLLSNGWDRYARSRAAQSFQLDLPEFEGRHQGCVAEFEVGRLTLDEYLAATVFYEDRQFNADDFKDFIYAQSQGNYDMLDLARSLQSSQRYLMVAFNNESMELNRHRIERFELRSLFSLFLSSCFVGIRKPDAGIYELALQVTQTEPGDAVIIDDREENLETGRRLGFHTVHCQGSAKEVMEGLKDLGASW